MAGGTNLAGLAIAQETTILAHWTYGPSEELEKGVESMNHRQYQITETDRWRLGRLLVSSEARAIAEPGVLGRLESQLEESRATQSGMIPDDVVTMNSTVHLVSETSGTRVICTVVYPEDVDLIDDGVSVLNVLGSNLIGCEVGDSVEWDSSGDRGPWRIIDIVFQPEKAGAFHL